MLPSRRFTRFNVITLLSLITCILVILSRLDSRTRVHTDIAFRTLRDRLADRIRAATALAAGGTIGSPGENDTVEEAAIRAWELSRATLFEGTGARVHRFLEKAVRGEPFVVAAIGGSVSKGRGLIPPEDAGAGNIVSRNEEEILGASTLYSPENLHVLVFDWLNETFPNGGGNRFVNGAQGGVGAGYFGWCFKEHIPEDVDLVLLELGINDLQQMDVIKKYEHLVRSVLELDSSPAIINIETFTTLFPALISSSSLHNDVLSYYDVPSLSIRDILVPRILADPDTQLPRWFRTGGDVALGDSKVREWGGVPVDLMHISAMGHALSAGLIINFLCEQLKRIVPSSGLLGKIAPARLREASLRVYDVPSTSLTDSFNPDDLPERRIPQCRSMNSAKLHNRISGTDDALAPDSERVKGLVLDSKSTGWRSWAWAEKHYMVAREPGSLAIFDFVTATPKSLLPAMGHASSISDPLHLAVRPASKRRMARAHTVRAGSDGGSVAIGYQRSANYGLGSVWCWVDSDRAGGRRLDGWWPIQERNMGIVDEVASGLIPGPHRLQCELLADTRDPLGQTEFRLFAVVHN